MLKKLSLKRVTDSEYFQQIDEDVQEFLTSIKPLKYTSILKMQEDDSRRKAQRDLELSNASKKDTGEDSAEEVENTEEKKEIQTDDYINESMAILADYINLQQKTE